MESSPYNLQVKKGKVCYSVRISPRMSEDKVKIFPNLVRTEYDPTSVIYNVRTMCVSPSIYVLLSQLSHCANCEGSQLKFGNGVLSLSP